VRYSLRQLQVFLAAARYENISRAAESLAMSQSAASSALKELESRFDLALFDRVGKSLKLNETGRLLRPKAMALLEQAEELEREMLQHQGLGAIRVGATLTIGNYLAVGIMAAYMNDFKGSTVSLEVANTSIIAHKLLNFDLDIALVEGEFHHQDLLAIPWREDDLVVCCSVDHPLSKKKKLSDKDLLNVDWVVREQGSGTRQTFDRAMAGIMPELNLLYELQHTEAIKHAVEENLGVACVSRLAVQDLLDNNSIKILSVPHRNFKRQFHFLLHKKKHRSEAIQHWLDYCMENF